MPFEKGKPKTGGRKKGVRNKFNADLAKLCEDEGFNPFQALLQMAKDPKTKGGVKLGALSELCEYMFPKRRRVEFEGQAFVHIVREVEELSKLPTEELKRLAREELEKTSEDE